MGLREEDRDRAAANKYALKYVTDIRGMFNTNRKAYANRKQHTTENRKEKEKNQFHSNTRKKHVYF